MNLRFADFRAYFPRFLAIFRAYFPWLGFPENSFALISPGLLGLKSDHPRVSRLFPPAFWEYRAYFPRPDLVVSDLSRLFPPVRLAFKSRKKATFALISPDLMW